ncbi:hypothetical protein PVAG01_03252 [Phlyctema vagabunda]|uniref:Uncharacterized protein n=1 Tax=Phlyctema vagabunda TaxID=108571 RepID=A0ABR4PT67_9HELO
MADNTNSDTYSTDAVDGSYAGSQDQYQGQDHHHDYHATSFPNYGNHDVNYSMNRYANDNDSRQSAGHGTDDAAAVISKSEKRMAKKLKKFDRAVKSTNCSSTHQG